MKNKNLKVNDEVTVVKNGYNDYNVYMQTEGYGCCTIKNVDSSFLKEKFNVVSF